MSLLPNCLLLVGIVITFQSTWGQHSSARDRISLRNHLRHPSVRRRSDPTEGTLSGISGSSGSVSLTSTRRGIGSSRQSLLRSRSNLRSRSGLTRRRLTSRRRTLGRRTSSAHSLLDSPSRSTLGRQTLRQDQLSDLPLQTSSSIRESPTRSALGRSAFGHSQLADIPLQTSSSLSDSPTFNQQDSLSRRNRHSTLIRSNNRQFTDIGIDHDPMFDGSLPARSPASHFEDPQFNIHHSPDQTINTRSQGRHLGSNPSLARPSEKQTTRELIQDINLLLNLIGPADANINGAPQPHTLPNQQTAPNEQVGGGTDAGLLNALITSHPAPNQMSSASSTSGMIKSFAPAQSGFAQATSTQLQLNSSAKSIVPATKTVLLTTPAPAPNAVEALSQVLGNSVPKSVAARMVNEILPSELRILNKGSQNGVATSGKGTPGQVTVRIVTEEPPEIDEILLREMLKKMRG